MENVPLISRLPPDRGLQVVRVDHTIWPTFLEGCPIPVGTEFLNTREASKALGFQIIDVVGQFATLARLTGEPQFSVVGVTFLRQLA